MQLPSTNGVSLMLIAGLSIVNFFGALALMSLENQPDMAYISSDPGLGDSDSVTLQSTPTASPISIRIDNVIQPGDKDREALELVNTGPALDLSGWTITEQGGSRYTFPPFTLFEGGGVIVYTRAGTDTPVRLYWGLDHAVWSLGETVTLRDAEGTIRATLIVSDAPSFSERGAQP